MTLPIDEILAVAESAEHRRTVTVKILLHQELAAQHRELETRLEAEVERDRHLNREPVAPQIAEEIAALEEQMDEHAVPFTLAALGKRAWADLKAKHPPTKEQRAAGADMNPDTIAVDAIAAACIEPQMTIEQVRRLEAALNETQFNRLFYAVIEANIGGGSVPKSPAITGLIRRANVRSASTAAPEESPEASSLDE